MFSEHYPSLAQIDTAAIVHNCSVIRDLIPQGCQLCVVVKCNAYGHGIETVLPALRSADVEMLGVAAINEAKRIRELKWDRPILLLGSEFSIYTGNQKKDLANWIVENQLRVTATNEDDIEALSAAAKSLKSTAVIHLMLDTGMSRMGLKELELTELINAIHGNEYVNIEGLYTHLATADEADKSFANEQLDRFERFIEKLQKIGLQVPLIHTANSSAAIDLPRSHFNMIRLGIAIYGCHSNPAMHKKPDIRPAMRVLSVLTLVKQVSAGSCIGYGCTYKAPDDMTIGLVPVGYADGYDRRLSNAGKMTISGHLVPVIGRVSMDQTIVDLSELVSKAIEVHPGQEVIVIDNVREAPNSVESLAVQLGTIPYEILTGLGPRIHRVPLGKP